MQMAQNGADYVKGEFTIPSDASSPYTLNFGKTFSKYLFFIELADESKSVIMNSSLAGRRAYTHLGKYPNNMFNNIENTNNTIVNNYAPSLDTVGYTQATFTCTDSSISYTCGAVTTNNNDMLIKGCKYNYYVVEIK